MGGGLAGLAAALHAGGAGWRVTLLESRRRLGGRASSFDDADSGRALDNCQHVLMGCCTHLLHLYEVLGVQEAITWHDRTWWLRPDGDRDVLAASRLPAPLHYARSFSHMRGLSKGARRDIRRAMWRVLRLRPVPRGSDATFGELLDAWNQRPEARTGFWDPIIVSALNVPADVVAAHHGVQVIRDGFLASAAAARMGVPSVPLRALYEPAEARLEALGGAVRLGTPATGIAIERRRAIGVQTREAFIRADAVVSALPWEKLDQLIDGEFRSHDTRLQGLHDLGHSPILGVHLVFDRPVLDVPHIVLPRHDVQWLFNRGRLDDGGQHLHAVISAADAWMDLSQDEIRDRVLADVRAACPEAGDAALMQCRAVKERRATFLATTAAERRRPAAAPSAIGTDGGDIEGLYLAGDWCATGWPATMEGAVRSGHAAAEALTGQGLDIAEAPAGWLFKLLCRR